MVATMTVMWAADVAPFSRQESLADGVCGRSVLVAGGAVIDGLVRCLSAPQGWRLGGTFSAGVVIKIKNLC